MIELLLKDKRLIKVTGTSEIAGINSDFQIAQFIDHSTSDLQWLTQHFGLDFSIMKRFEDIEISSHFLEHKDQASFHFSIPLYNNEKQIVEEPVFIVVSKERLFLFSSSNLDAYFNENYSNKTKAFLEKDDPKDILKLQFEFISDYFADITEGLTKKIKNLANLILIERKFSSKEADIITEYNFSNLLIKESIIETTRVFKLYLKSDLEQKMDLKETISRELNDLSVVSDYIQFNFDRLDDLKENVSNKIDLEQNHIFKTLTVVTVCISIPTLIAGVYGMNFENMPELKTTYGYPIVIILMLVAAILPFIYFRRKKWF